MAVGYLLAWDSTARPGGTTTAQHSGLSSRILPAHLKKGGDKCVTWQAVDVTGRVPTAFPPSVYTVFRECGLVSVWGGGLRLWIEI